jgi:hypothetical protein
LFAAFEVEGSDDAIFVRLLQDHFPAFVAELGYGFESRLFSCADVGVLLANLGSNFNDFFSRPRNLEIVDNSRAFPPAEVVALLVDTGDGAVFPFRRRAGLRFRSLLSQNRLIGW